MEALTLARRAIRATLAQQAIPRPVRLAHGLMERGQSRFLPMLSSRLARNILEGGYTPGMLEHVYSRRTCGHLLGKVTDLLVLDLPVHSALRERFQATVGELCAAVVPVLRAGKAEARLFHAPCGLGSELVALAGRLDALEPGLVERVSGLAVDRDPQDQVLRLASRRLRDTGLKVRCLREDLRRRRGVSADVEAHGGYDVACCVGLRQELTGEETARQLAFVAGLLNPGGRLLIDRWNPVPPGSRHGVGVPMCSTSAGELTRWLTEAGLVVEREHPTGEGGCVLVVARRPEAS